MSHLLEADESGSLTIPPDVLGHSTPHARNIVETDDRGIHIAADVLENAARNLPRSGLTVHSEEWNTLAEEIGQKWTSDLSAAEVVSEMR
jgi:hypothetical protein